MGWAPLLASRLSTPGLLRLLWVWVVWVVVVVCRGLQLLLLLLLQGRLNVVLWPTLVPCQHVFQATLLRGACLLLLLLPRANRIKWRQPASRPGRQQARGEQAGASSRQRVCV